MSSTDDVPPGYLGDVDVSFFSSASDLSFSSDSMCDGSEARERCSPRIMEWLASPRPPCTCNIEAQTDREVVPELWEEGAGTEHSRAHLYCNQGRPYCPFGASRCFSCMSQEGGESSSSDSDLDGLGKMPIMSPSRIWGWLYEYLSEENAGKSVSPTGHNSKTSQARFDGRENYFGVVELLAPLEGRGDKACIPVEWRFML